MLPSPKIWPRRRRWRESWPSGAVLPGSPNSTGQGRDAPGAWGPAECVGRGRRCPTHPAVRPTPRSHSRASGAVRSSLPARAGTQSAAAGCSCRRPQARRCARAPRTATKARGQAFESAVARCRTPGVEEGVSSEPEPVDPSPQTNPMTCCWCRTASARCYPLPRLRHVTVCRNCYRHITGVEPETDHA